LLSNELAHGPTGSSLRPHRCCCSSKYIRWTRSLGQNAMELDEAVGLAGLAIVGPGLIAVTWPDCIEMLSPLSVHFLELVLLPLDAILEIHQWLCFQRRRLVLSVFQIDLDLIDLAAIGQTPAMSAARPIASRRSGWPGSYDVVGLDAMELGDVSLNRLDWVALRPPSSS